MFLNRHSDIDHTGAVHRHAAVLAGPKATVLPPVRWSEVGCAPPERIAVGARQPSDPLPAADIVIVTWTSAEWFALDHVLLNSARQGDATDHTWKKAWHPYTRGASEFTSDASSGALWGSFQLVRITDRSRRPWRVLLFKSNAHLAHPPWITGLTAMLGHLLDDTRADRIYSIGTAGGARFDQRLGDCVATNAALLELERPDNTLDASNGNMYRCPTWFPATGLFGSVADKLLFKLDQVVTPAALRGLFGQLRAKHPADPGLAELKLDDLLNNALRPEALHRPRITALKDVALLTTDFYYIAGGDSADAYAFLEMDDAVIAREANKRGVRFACIRNISDPVVRKRTDEGKPISDAVRADWSGLIYTSFGLFTSYNGALATWATIAGDGRSAYDPVRRDHAAPPAAGDDPLEVKLAFGVRSCGSCKLFWPTDPQAQPYGPYTAFDVDVNTPYSAPAGPAEPGAAPRRWLTGRTRPPAFPNPEVIDGCRKAPIMTIGINPNLTAFAPGQTGAAWAYPDFSSDGDSDAWAKYAWYYRYRTVYQERLTLDFVRRFVLPDGQIVASRGGHIVSASRTSNAPAWRVSVRYDGDSADSQLELPGVLGEFPYVLLFDSYPPNNRFAAGDVIAGKLAVPDGIQVEVLQQAQRYYLQFVPVLQHLQDTLRANGHRAAELRIGEDVAQLDMVACASPHWNANFLGGSAGSIATIVDNCVSSNAWAIKQLVQSRPAVLYIVSESSWNMFHAAFGAHVRRDPPISARPADRDFTLLRETTDLEHPAYLDLEVSVDGTAYKLRTRLVITPHFSYNANFAPQIRVSPSDWQRLVRDQPACVAAMTVDSGITLTVPPAGYPGDYTVLQLPPDRVAASAALSVLRGFPEAWQILGPGYCDPHALMAVVLDDLYRKGQLRWYDRDDGSGYLARTEGSCRFCVNRHWQFPGECRYGKPDEEPPPAGFLEKVAARVVATGKPAEPARSDELALRGPPLFVAELP